MFLQPLRVGFLDFQAAHQQPWLTHRVNSIVEFLDIFEPVVEVVLTIEHVTRPLMLDHLLVWSFDAAVVSVFCLLAESR